MDKENEPTKILEFLARIKTVRQAASSMTFQAFPLRQMIKATLFSECSFNCSWDECGSKRIVNEGVLLCTNFVENSRKH